MPAIRNPPAMQETWVWSPGQEDPLEEDMATHSSILAWRVPWTEEPSATVHRVTKSWTHMHAWLIQPVEIISVTIQWKGMITSKIPLTPLETNVYLLFQTELKHFEFVYGFLFFYLLEELDYKVDLSCEVILLSMFSTILSDPKIILMFQFLWV